MNNIENEYCKIYYRLRKEIRDALFSLYYLYALKEVDTLDKYISFKNEFIYQISQNFKEKVCLQIYKLILDGTDNNRKSIEYFVKFINNHELFQDEINFYVLEFVDQKLEKLITRYRHNHINHIQFDDELNAIKMCELEDVLLKIVDYFNGLYKKELIVIDDRFFESTLMNIRQQCKIAVKEAMVR